VLDILNILSILNIAIFIDKVNREVPLTLKNFPTSFRLALNNIPLF